MKIDSRKIRYKKARTVSLNLPSEPIFFFIFLNKLIQISIDLHALKYCHISIDTNINQSSQPKIFFIDTNINRSSYPKYFFYFIS